MIPYNEVSHYQSSRFCFGDARLNRRCQFSLEHLFEKGSDKSFPYVFSKYKQLKGFYRLMNNNKVSPTKIQQGANAGLVDFFTSSAYCGQDDYLYNYTDSSFGKYHERQVKLGYLEMPTDNGLLIHSGILTDSTFIPLGVSHQEFITRAYENYGKSKNCGRRSFAEKESFKWTKGIDWAEEFSPKLGLPIINIMDREADSVEVYNYAFAKQQLFIVRSKSNRKVIGAKVLLHQYLEQQPERLRTQRQLIDRKGKKHLVTCSIRYAQVQLNNFDALVWAIQLQAIDPPAELEETRWTLLTNFDLEPSPDLSIRVVDIYTKRWCSTEDFHKCLKSGCRIEQRQFRSMQALINSIALLSICAVRLLRMRHMSQAKPEAPLSQVLNQQQIKLAKVLAEEYLLDSDLKHCQEHTLLWWVLLLGRMGGHQGFKMKGLPGWQTLYRGWNYFQTILNGINLSKNFFNSS